MKLYFVNIHYRYPGISTPALDGVTVELNLGERVALLGRNGGGKSTLMLIANGILRPQDGEVYLDGCSVRYDRRSLFDLRQRVGVVFQNPDDQLFTASVLQDISLGPLNLGLSQVEARRRVMEAAHLCGLEALLERPTHALSGGEKTRAALAGVLAMEPLYLFADEITNSLDPWMRNQILDIFERWVEDGRTVVLATHDWSLARRWAQRIIWLDRGRVYRQGASADVLSGWDDLQALAMEER